jgi:hypothetical protein
LITLEQEPFFAMCLPPEAHAEYLRLAKAMDDAQLHKLDRHYSQELGRFGNTVDMQLHSIVRHEIAVRRERRVAQLKRSLWLSSRRGRCVESIKRWLVRHRLWSSDRQRVPEQSESPRMISTVRLAVMLLTPLLLLNRTLGSKPCAPD